MTVGLVIVSHSAKLAAGVAELAGQMAPGVPLVAAGGMPDGGIGTDFAAVAAAVAEADRGDGVVLLFDLGSAQMTADMAVESLDDPSRAVVAEAPLVEGAVAAAVAAAGGADLAGVVAAATGAAPAVEPETPAAHEPAGQAPATQAPATQAPATQEPAAGDEQSTEVVLTNDIGLHARPAAVLARTVGALDAQVTVRFGDRTADARSVLALLGLAARKGDRLTVTARGPRAAEALERIRDLVDGDFGEQQH